MAVSALLTDTRLAGATEPTLNGAHIVAPVPRDQIFCDSKQDEYFYQA